MSRKEMVGGLLVFGTIAGIVWFGSDYLINAAKKDYNLISESNRSIISRYDANHNKTLESSELANLLNDYRLEEIK